VIDACDRNGAVVILGSYYQRQDQILKDEAAVRAGVVNVARWVRDSGFTNVVLEIAKESAHPGFDHPILTDIRGNNPVHVLGKEHSIDPPGPDGAPAATDAVAFGKYVRRSTRQSPDNPHYPYSLQFNVNPNGDIPELPLDAFWKGGLEVTPSTSCRLSTSCGSSADVMGNSRPRTRACRLHRRHRNKWRRAAGGRKRWTVNRRCVRR
jgi:hypothetical protein